MLYGKLGPTATSWWGVQGIPIIPEGNSIDEGSLACAMKTRTLQLGDMEAPLSCGRSADLLRECGSDSFCRLDACLASASELQLLLRVA